MTCPHTATTAILAVFDEAPADFADHLAGCSTCQIVVDEHRQTVAAITPTLLAQPRRPASRYRYWPAAALLLAAATALFSLRQPPLSQPTPSLSTLDISHDHDLFSLELELALMELED
jgi:hypothetical protein